MSALASDEAELTRSDGSAERAASGTADDGHGDDDDDDTSLKALRGTFEAQTPFFSWQPANKSLSVELVSLAFIPLWLWLVCLEHARS